MPENENNNLPRKNNEFLDMPKPNNNPTNETHNMVNELPVEHQSTEKKPIIEIPQSYYDKLAREEAEIRQKQQEEQNRKQELLENPPKKTHIFAYSIITAIVTFFSLYGVLNIHELTILIIPVFIVVFSIIATLKEKKESQFPVSVMVGGMIVAVLTFVLSMLQEDKMDMWTYYAIAGAIVAFLGMTVANIIEKIMTERKNIKALESIGYILFFIAIIAVPAYLYTNYKDVFYKYVFQQQVVVEAETEEEFVMKTLKNRYNTDFTCDKTKEKHQINQDNRKIVARICTDSVGNEIEVKSIAYNEGKNEYIVIDNYIDVLYLNPTKNYLMSDLKALTHSNKVVVYLYPEENCTFIGDCAQCNEYVENLEKETNIDNQFDVSVKLNLTKELTNNSKDYINNHNYKFIIEITSSFDETTLDKNALVNSVLDRLNQIGYKNNYGFTIRLIDDLGYELIDTIYEVDGKTNSNKTFKEYEVVDLTK